MTTFDIRECDGRVVQDLCTEYHGYKSAGIVFTYAFAVYEQDRPVAAFGWNPPPPGAAKSVCPGAPFAVLSLSRMVAVPKTQRKLKHISKPLRFQMKHLIDRTRWPVLVTWSDEGQGHTGYVYKCSGFTATLRSKRPVYEDANGTRKSMYCAGKSVSCRLVAKPPTTIQRWEHRTCSVGEESAIVTKQWQRVAIAGKAYTSGKQAYTWQRITTTEG